MAYKNFGAETLTAADVNNLLMRQSVIRVANATEQAAITSPEIGMVSKRADLAYFEYWNGTAWVYAFGPTPWINLAYPSDWNPWGTQPQYRIVNSFAEFRGTFMSTQALTTSYRILCSGAPIPVNAPNAASYPVIPVGISSNNVGVPGYINIRSDGYVRVNSSGTVAGPYVTLDGVRYAV